MLTDGLEWCGLLVDYCDVFISCLDSHSDGTHSLQRIHWWDSDEMLHFSTSVLMKKQTHLHLGQPEGGVNLQQIHFRVNYSFNAEKPITSQRLTSDGRRSDVTHLSPFRSLISARRLSLMSVLRFSTMRSMQLSRTRERVWDVMFCQHMGHFSLRLRHSRMQCWQKLWAQFSVTAWGVTEVKGRVE